MGQIEDEAGKLNAPAEPIHQSSATQRPNSQQSRAEFQMNFAFSKRFSGAATDITGALRNELSRITPDLVDLLHLEYSAAQSSLVIVFPENRLKEVKPALYWISNRYGKIHPSLKDFAAEVEAHRLAREQGALRIALLRKSSAIIDPDPESNDARIQIAEPELPASQRALLTYSEAKSEYIDARSRLEAAQLRLSERKVMNALEPRPQE